MPWIIHYADVTPEVPTTSDYTSHYGPHPYYSPDCWPQTWLYWQPTRDDAQYVLERASSYLPDNPDNRPIKISLVITPRDNERWQAREANRFINNEYIRVPWHTDLPEIAGHFLHIALGSSEDFAQAKLGMVAYTASPEHGFQDRQTRVRAGRYLAKFYPNLSPDQVRQYAEKMQSGALQLQLATTKEDIRKAYFGNRMNSCMAHPVSSYASRPHHPIDAYADSDLAVAYYGPIDNVSARCVVWPEKKVYNRIFGANTLRYLLEAHGYSQGSLEGARLKLIPTQGTYVCPYIDNADGVSIRDNHLVITSDYDYECTRTDGLLEDPDEDDNDDEIVCDHCGEMFDAGDATTVRVWSRVNHRYSARSYCPYCTDHNAVVCADCHTMIRNTSASRLEGNDGSYYCHDCINNQPHSCAVADCSTRWHEATAFDEQRDASVQSRICATHATDGWTYDTCTGQPVQAQAPLPLNTDTDDDQPF